MKHKCAPCKKEFETEEEFLNHKCEKANNAKPTEADYLRRTTTPNYDKIAEKAKERGQQQ